MLYLVATTRRKNRQDLTGKINDWKSVLNTLHVHYGDRIQLPTDHDPHARLHNEPDSGWWVGWVYS